MRRQTRCTPLAIQGPPQILSEPQMQNPRGVGGCWEPGGRTGGVSGELVKDTQRFEETALCSK